MVFFGNPLHLFIFIMGWELLFFSICPKGRERICEYLKPNICVKLFCKTLSHKNYICPGGNELQLRNLTSLYSELGDY